MPCDEILPYVARKELAAKAAGVTAPLTKMQKSGAS
jgi:hypothetical protein